MYSFFRIPFLELGIIKPKHTMCEKPDFDKTEKNEENVLKFMSHSLDFVLSLKRPRIIKTHLPIELLPIKLLETGKVRNQYKSRIENLNKRGEKMSSYKLDHKIYKSFQFFVAQQNEITCGVSDLETCKDYFALP